MADFDKAFEVMLRNEGGYRHTNIKGDRGGETYAGISRNFWPNWEGWPLLDGGAYTESLVPLVKKFYRENFWEPVKGESIKSQEIATAIFDFAVNAGIWVSIRLAQKALGVQVDGRIGPQTMGALNKTDPEKFLCKFTVEKIRRYADICNKNKPQRKFLLGWINRSLAGLSL